MLLAEITTWHVIEGVLALVALYLFTWGFVPLILLKKKPWPTSTVAWIMAVVTLPYFGALLYVVFGINRVERRVTQRQAAARRINRLVPQLAGQHLVSQDRFSPAQRQLLRVAERVSGAKATLGNRVQLYAETSDAFAAIEATLRAARESIHLEYYIWQPDRIGTRLRDILIERARAGVKVRFLYDTLGSMRLTKRFLAEMQAAGITVAPFLPGRSLRERWSINLRNHRKIILVDGAIGFTGGMNVGDEYLGRDPHFGYWRDTHLRVTGPAVLQLQEVFVTDWYSATGEELDPVEHFPSPDEIGKVTAQVIAGGPDQEESAFHALMFAAIAGAEREVTLATSYFVPTPALCMALQSAALRGVRTRVLVSGPVTYWTTYHACRSYYDELLQSGVDIYEYRKGQQHAKTLTVDGEWSLVGSPNFDARSVFLNFEVAAAFFDAGIAEQLTHHFEEDLAGAVRIEPTEWGQRSTWERLKENTSRMFAPVL